MQAHGNTMPMNVNREDLSLCDIVTAAIWIFNLNFNIFTLSTL